MTFIGQNSLAITIKQRTNLEDLRTEEPRRGLKGPNGLSLTGSRTDEQKEGWGDGHQPKMNSSVRWNNIVKV